MAFDNLQQFIAMGGYGLYVWLSIGVTLVGIIGIALSNVLERRQLVRKVNAERQRRARIKDAKRTASLGANG